MYITNTNSIYLGIGLYLKNEHDINIMKDLCIFLLPQATSTIIPCDIKKYMAQSNPIRDRFHASVMVKDFSHTNHVIESVYKLVILNPWTSYNLAWKREERLADQSMDQFINHCAVNQTNNIPIPL